VLKSVARHLKPSEINKSKKYFAVVFSSAVCRATNSRAKHSSEHSSSGLERKNKKWVCVPFDVFYLKYA